MKILPLVSHRHSGNQQQRLICATVWPSFDPYVFLPLSSLTRQCHGNSILANIKVNAKAALDARIDRNSNICVGLCSARPTWFIYEPPFARIICSKA